MAIHPAAWQGLIGLEDPFRFVEGAGVLYFYTAIKVRMYGSHFRPKTIIN